LQRLSTVTGDRHSLLGIRAEHCSKTMAKCSLRQASQQEDASDINAESRCLSSMPKQCLNVSLLCCYEALF